MKIKRIAYYTPQIDVRGTCTALYDYAVSMREFYGIDAVVITKDYGEPGHDRIAIQKYSTAFNILRYKPSGVENDVKSIDELIEYSKSDMLYCIKYGTNDGIVSKSCPTAVHCVFDLSQPHGTIYAAVASTLARKYGKKEFVPHMIRLRPSRSEETLRHALQIPEDAVVIGRYGGMDTFNLAFAQTVISSVVRQYKNTYFLFANTPQFDTHPQLKFMGQLISDEEKSRFIKTCDAHLEAGTLGHSFGLAIGEFSAHNKPAIVYDCPQLWNRSHLEILGEKCLKFRDMIELHTIITTFDKGKFRNSNWNCYEEYSPEIVAAQFYDVFVKPCSD